jgi:NADH-ubiquinone oxidoreductase chain 5
MLIIAAITTFFASFVAFFQYDLKKIIAYSTCAQLGLMFVACALNQYIIALFHLFNHAFFKALLFLCAGIIIHGSNDEQDIRKFGNFKEFFPITYKGFFIASLSLMGFPGLTGFYSKDPIFEVLLSNTNNNSILPILFVSLGTFFTAAYSIRVLILVFYGKYAGNINNKYQIHETNDKYLLIPIIILTVLSIIGGAICAPYFLNPDTTMFKKANLAYYVDTTFLNVEELPSSLKLLPLFLTIFGSVFGFICTNNKLFSRIMKIRLIAMLSNIKRQEQVSTNYNNYIIAILRVFHFDNVYNTFIIKPITFFSYSILYKQIEKGLLEYFGPTGIGHIIKAASNYIYNYNKTNLSTILLTLFLFVFLIIFFSFFRA